MQNNFTIGIFIFARQVERYLAHPYARLYLFPQNSLHALTKSFSVLALKSLKLLLQSCHSYTDYLYSASALATPDGRWDTS